jgi:hypothetical protein
MTNIEAIMKCVTKQKPAFGDLAGTCPKHMLANMYIRDVSEGGFAPDTVYMGYGTGKYLVPTPAGVQQLWVVSPDAWFTMDGTLLTDPAAKLQLMVADVNEAWTLFNLQHARAVLSYAPRTWYDPITTSVAAGHQAGRRLVGMIKDIWTGQPWQALMTVSVGLMPFLRDKLRAIGLGSNPLVVVAGKPACGKSRLARAVSLITGKAPPSILACESHGCALVKGWVRNRRCLPYNVKPFSQVHGPQLHITSP